jgi:hypothetical protein
MWAYHTHSNKNLAQYVIRMDDKVKRLSQSTGRSQATTVTMGNWLTPPLTGKRSGGPQKFPL